MKQDNIDRLIEAGNWQLTMEKFIDFRASSIKSYGYIGSVMYGNYVYDISSTIDKSDESDRYITLEAIKPSDKYDCIGETCEQQFDIHIDEEKYNDPVFGSTFAASDYTLRGEDFEDLHAFKKAVVRELLAMKCISPEKVEQYEYFKKNSCGFFQQVHKAMEKYKYMDTKNFIDVCDWSLDNNALNALREGEPCVILDIGSVNIGNDIFKLTAFENFGKLNIEYVHKKPLPEYESFQMKEKPFDFELNHDNLDINFHIYNNGGNCKSCVLDVLAKDEDFSGVKEAICNMLQEDHAIFFDKALNYKSIKENGTSFVNQLDKAIEGYYQKILSKNNLSQDDMSCLAQRYDKIVSAAFDVTKNDVVKAMINDGLSDKFIKKVSRNMESINGGFTPDWASDVLKKREIKDMLKAQSRKKNAGLEL